VSSAANSCHSGVAFLQFMSRYLVLGQLWEKGHKIHAV